MKSKTCCFIGHRKIELTEKLKKEIYDYIEYLIVNENVKTFLFGSKSKFDYLCHGMVTELKERYSDIKRIGYTCKSEGVILETEKEKREKLLPITIKGKVRLLGVEEEYEHKNKYVSGKASYVERNEAMIDDGDYCVFYYNENYVPPKRKVGAGFYETKSGTAIAYKYAKRKNKIIKNFYR